MISHKSMKQSGLSVLFLFLFALLFSSCQDDKTPKILVFSKTKGYHHASIPKGIAAIQKIGEQEGYRVDTTTDASIFRDENLKKYRSVVFLSTTGNVLNGDQQVALERYVQAGGGFVGIHAAADTEYDWPWYNKLVGAYFLSHPQNPNVLKATVEVTDTAFAATAGLPQRWERTDEWYNYKNIYPDLKVVAVLDEDTYDGGENGENHPTAWYHDFDGGRAFYTGGGHTDESFSEPLFLKHLAGGIRYAMGDSTAVLDYSKAYAVKVPEENRFTKVILSNDLNEPMELAVAPDGRVFFIERSGNLYQYDPATKQTKVAHRFAVLPEPDRVHGNGLLGITVDPDFKTNNYLYLYYTPDGQPIEQLSQYVSRFTISKDGALDLKSEKVVLKVPIDLEVSAHTGGSLAWDKDKNLYISTGDNTVPFESSGYAPIDETPGRKTFDAQRSSGNTNDLRGKILRIHPEPDGTYTIPEGNLFAKGTAQTRPEIYVMGCRNPYRISVDQKTSIVYWGEIGPDAGEDGKQGPRGYDEFNQAKKAGNYGWPYFVGNSKPYHDYDFASKTVGELANPKAPVNTSPNNTGLKQLPPVQNAMVWYPYNASEEFPDLGEGGRCAMGGPVYHYQEALNSKVKLPAYYDKALFAYDWMRNWVYALRLDENQQYKRMEPFMPVTGDFKRPVDMEIGPDGAMYMLEYGSVYGVDNPDARLVRIEFNAENRAPVAQISVEDSIGQAPLKVAFSNKSFDFDEDDKLTYEWRFEGNKVGSTEANPSYTFQKNGVYKAILKVTDPSGKTDRDTFEIKVGNTLPKVAISTPDNSTFFFDNANLRYNVAIQDKEDPAIAADRMLVTLTYIPKVKDQQASAGHQDLKAAPVNLGKALMESSDCKACHQIDKKSVGPAFMLVSQKYKGQPNEVARLANKVITGGGGVWGEHAMNAHPQLSREEATEIVKYVLSLSEQPANQRLPQQGSVALKEHMAKGGQGRYVLQASYTDNGGAIVPLTGTDALVLRPARVLAAQADVLRNIERHENQLGAIHNRSYFVLKNIDLRGIRTLAYRYSSKDKDATLEVHTGSAKGPVISTLHYKATGNWDTYNVVSAPVTAPDGKNDLYFVIKKEQEPNQHLFNLDWIEFKR
ncbi:ThuA domain-containing protein [Pontibacter liquoris]|uniref:ThuA domain-containing protein n=1 Tax=Pontibacter liquoris TaxID=2905677 RepID=UPI001FA6C68E|nr:ThuA domain-containing protein [Pontibacter liquoris]